MSEQIPLVGILMGSDNDYAVMVEAAKALKEFGIPFEMTVSSAHRPPSAPPATRAAPANGGSRSSSPAPAPPRTWPG